MDPADEQRLDFAYRYPFSEEAKQIFAKAPNSIEERYLEAGRVRIEEDLRGGVAPEVTRLSSLKQTQLMSYAYSRMLVSAINNPYYTTRYVNSEAERAYRLLESDTLENVLKVTKELGIALDNSGERFNIKFTYFLMLSPKSDEPQLIKQQLDNGIVNISRQNALALIRTAIANEIGRNLPIRSKELPRLVIDYSKKVKLPVQRSSARPAKGNYSWIENLLQNPIPDVRHRTINLVLAPYLVNVKGLEVESAVAVISEYIERCKQLNPDTRINDTYIKYQCRYAKEKGMKPLSRERARELFKGVIEI